MSSRLLFNLGSATSRLTASSPRTNNIICRLPPSQFLSARFSTEGDADSTSPAESETTVSSELKIGIVEAFYGSKQFGIIKEVNPADPANPSKFFIHRNDILKYDTGDDENKYWPVLRKSDRVQFKVADPKEGTKLPKAYDLTLEGGEKVPPFASDYLGRYERMQRARFGDEVFEIMSTSVDQNEMEGKIVEAFERVRRNIERQKAKVDWGKKVAAEKYEE